MRGLSRIVLVGVTALMLSGPLYSQGSAHLPTHGSITVDVVNSFGTRQLYDVRIELYRAGFGSWTSDHERVPPKGRPGRYSGIPYGYYVVQVEGQSFRHQQRLVFLNTEHLRVRMGLPPRFGHEIGIGGDNLEIRGRVAVNGRAGGGFWARVRGVFLCTSREAIVDERGRFSVTGLNMGTYIVEVLEAAKLRHSQTIEIDTNQHVTELEIMLDVTDSAENESEPPAPLR
jgi:hypothetical protein